MKVTNKNSFRNYEILEKFEAGIVLSGQEVKSIKSGKISFKGSYITIREGEAFLINFHVSAYQPGNVSVEYKPERPRKLLLHRKEINYLTKKTNEKGLTLVPLSVYTNRGKIKIEIAVAKGKKKFDKREDIKKRDTEREIRRNLKKKI